MEIDLFIRNLTWDKLDSKTREITKRCILDTLGCALAGVQSENFLSLVNMVRSLDEKSESPIWGTEISVGLSWSIFLNTYSASYFDIDDGHRKAAGHPGAAIVPAALSTSNSLGLSGKAFLEAVVAGYEIAIRSALVMRGLGGPRKGSGAWVGPGVAAAIAKLIDLDSERIKNAIGLAEYYAPQITADRAISSPSQAKEGMSWGAYSGYISAFLASNGFTGMRPHLADSSFIEDLSVKYEIENVYVKRYACGRWAHPAMDGLEEMLRETGRNGSEINQIRIKTFDKAALLDRKEPSGTIEAI
jgi:2-methylcitrate dehydratase PrpD